MPDRVNGRGKSTDRTPSTRTGTGRTGAGKDTKADTGAPLTEPGSRAVALVLLLAVLLFAMMLRGAHILVSTAGDPAVAAIQVATFLSSILLAGMLLGGAAGTGAVRILAGHDGDRLTGRSGRRAVLAILGGLVAGVIAGGAAFLLEGDLSTTEGLIVGTSIAGAALLGGVVAALRPGVMVVAGLLGTVVVIAVLALRSIFLTPLTRLFGGDGIGPAYVQAQDRLALVSFIVAGAVAGLAAHLYIRRAGNRLGTTANIVAGAAPGILALAAQVLTWIGNSRLISSAGGLDLGDNWAFQVAGSYQINGSLALLFAGALVAVLLYGRTRGPRTPRKPRTTPPKADWAVREERRAAELDRADAKQAGTKQAGAKQAGAKQTDAKQAGTKQAGAKQSAGKKATATEDAPS